MVETSTFGAELILAQISMEKFKALHTKLRLLDISIYGPTYMFCDNEIVVKSMSRAESTLSKKHQLISWHSVREATSAGWLRFLKDPGETNLADICTRKLPIKRRKEILN